MTHQIPKIRCKDNFNEINHLYLKMYELHLYKIIFIKDLPL